MDSANRCNVGKTIITPMGGLGGLLLFYPHESQFHQDWARWPLYCRLATTWNSVALRPCPELSQRFVKDLKSLGISLKTSAICLLINSDIV